MGKMIDMGEMISGARAGSDLLSMPSFERGMGAYRRPVTASATPYVEPAEPGNPGPVVAYNTQYGDLNLGAVRNPDTLGGSGGDRRSYVPMQDLNDAGLVSNITGTTYADQPEETPEVSVEQQEREIEQVVQYGTIHQLLEALRRMASMQPGEGGNPVFQLDDMYKKSSATQGIPGTVAQYPTAGSITRETDYNL